jgi:hypothetical protein
MPAEATTAPPPAPAVPPAAPTPTPPPAPTKGPVPSQSASLHKGPAWDGVRAGLRAAADKGPTDFDKPADAPAQAQPAPTEKPTPPPKVTKAEPVESTPEPPPEPTPPPAKTPPAEKAEEIAKPAEKAKLGPWQLKEKYEKLAKTYEKEATELRQRLASMGDTNALREKAEKFEARNKELEEAIRYHDYTKSEEYKDQFQKPYEEAWAKAVSDLREITITDAEGNTRQATAQDLIQLANLPLSEARKRANEMFGETADDVMAHRRAIRELADKQDHALEENKKTGVQREQERMETQRKVSEEVGSLWHQFNSADEAKYEFLKPKEGDDEWNTKLEGAKKFVNDAFLANAGDPKLTPEQRADIIRQHVSVRGRAIGFTALRLENTRLKAQLAEVQKVVASYKKAEPGAGDGHATTAAPVTPQNRMQSIFQQMRARAK